MRQEANQPTLLYLADFSEGAAEAAVRWWLDERLPTMSPAPVQAVILAGRPKARAGQPETDVRGRIARLLAALRVPTLPSDAPGCFVVDATRLSTQRAADGAGRWAMGVAMGETLGGTSNPS